MRGLRDWGLSAVLCVLAVGCTPSPKKTCDHYLELRVKESAKSDPSVGEACVSKLTELKGRSSKAWGCTSGCIKKADTVQVADQCPSTCETSYGNDGAAFLGPEADQVYKRWENGIVPGERKDNVPAYIREKAAMEEKAFQVCIPRCKGQYEVATKQYGLCLALCKKEQYAKMP